MVTISDVAAYAGVGPSTVSRVLNDSPRVSDTTRARVRDACETSELLLVGRAGREIVRVATEQESELVVMGVHGRSVVDLAIFGSVTHHVVRHAPCPVWSGCRTS